MNDIRHTFDQVDVLLVDTDLNARQGVRTILSNNGFSGVTLGTDLAKVRDAVNSRMPDLLLCGTEFPDGKVTDMIRDIRQNRIGNNPFMPIIVLLSEPTPALVQEIITAGADDVVMKPVSTKALLDRIHTQIHRRKPYIVQEEYLGPARKGDDTSRAIEPPNPLHAKATGGQVRFHEIERAIDNALMEVRNRKLENTGPEIAALVGRIVPMIDNKPKVSQTALGGLHMLIDMNNDLIKRLAGTKYDHVSELSKAMVAVAQRLCDRAEETPDQTQVKLLKPLSQAIQAGFSGGINSVDAAKQIVQRIGVKYD
ncbi:MAG: response regulator [Rhodospirillales bacterium]|nr:response regulator [Rhodospirillales bacterium]